MGKSKLLSNIESINYDKLKEIVDNQSTLTYKQITEILNIANDSSSLEDFISKIESMIEADKELIKSLSK